MEINHQSGHHEKKTWRSYFWEFFMLFLAENIREHQVERTREFEYIGTMASDPADDVVADLFEQLKRLYPLEYFPQSRIQNS
jgi:hypothetical protein